MLFDANRSPPSPTLPHEGGEGIARRAHGLSPRWVLPLPLPSMADATAPPPRWGRDGEGVIPDGGMNDHRIGINIDGEEP